MSSQVFCLIGQKKPQRKKGASYLREWELGRVRVWGHISILV